MNEMRFMPTLGTSFGGRTFELSPPAGKCTIIASEAPGFFLTWNPLRGGGVSPPRCGFRHEGSKMVGKCSGWITVQVGCTNHVPNLWPEGVSSRQPSGLARDGRPQRSRPTQRRQPAGQWSVGGAEKAIFVGAPRARK